MVMLARLTPVFPFLIGNYAFGITRIPTAHYLGASLVGTIPSTALYTYLGTLLGDLAILGALARAYVAGMNIFSAWIDRYRFAFLFFEPLCSKSLVRIRVKLLNENFVAEGSPRS